MNIVVCGFGRASKVLVDKILRSNEHNLLMVLCRNESPKVNKRISDIMSGAMDSDIMILPIDKAFDVLSTANVDVIIDFSHRDMAIQVLNLAVNLKTNLVICTTNHLEKNINIFRTVAEKKQIGLAYCPNLTIGINLLIDFGNRMSRIFPEFSFEIVEKHPSDKSKPTATARIIAEGAGHSDIPIHSIRMGGYVGEHMLIGSDGIERITITHESLSREAFAKGAMEAAKFLENRKGFFMMKDIVKNMENVE